MRRHDPSWWYGGEHDRLVSLLRPAGALYGWIAQRRFERATPYRSTLPVICVGNFTAGGTGKTPLALRLADELVRLGERPAFLTRGYGGRIKGPHWVAAGHDTADDVGDEALLLAERTPALVSADRRAGAVEIEASGRHSVIIMDDGLQNPLLAKDLTIAVVDGHRGLGNGEVLPAGPLRAPFAFQLGLVDAVVVNSPPSLTGPQSGITGWLKERFPGPVLETSARPVENVEWLKGARVVAYAGIGHPQRFFSLLAELGAVVQAAVPLPDHHRFTEADAAQILQMARMRNATLITTSKDLARLGAKAGALGELARESRVLPIELAFGEREASRLTALVTAMLAARRAAADRPQCAS